MIRCFRSNYRVANSTKKCHRKRDIKSSYSMIMTGGFVFELVLFCLHLCKGMLKQMSYVCVHAYLPVCLFLCLHAHQSHMPYIQSQHTYLQTDQSFMCELKLKELFGNNSGQFGKYAVLKTWGNSKICLPAHLKLANHHIIYLLTLYEIRMDIKNPTCEICVN